MKVITYCAEVTSGYLGTVTGKILFVQSGLLYLAHHCQLYGESHFLAVTRLIITLIRCGLAIQQSFIQLSPEVKLEVKVINPHVIRLTQENVGYIRLYSQILT